MFDLEEVIFRKRDLNIYENSVYKCKQIVANKLTGKFWLRSKVRNNYNIPNNISSLEEFMVAFHTNYLFYTWKHVFDWNNFFIAGESIVSSILKKDWSDSLHVVDIYSINLNYQEFNRAIYNGLTFLDSKLYIFTNYGKIKRLKLYVYNWGGDSMKIINIKFMHIAKSITPSIVLHNLI